MGCPALTNPRNGRVEVSRKTGRIKAIYSCDRGFVLRGSSIRQCVGGGYGKDKCQFSSISSVAILHEFPPGCFACI